MDRRSDRLHTLTRPQPIYAQIFDHVVRTSPLDVAPNDERVYPAPGR